MLPAIPILFSIALSRTIQVDYIDEVPFAKRQEASYSLSPNLVGVIGKTLNETLQNEPSLNITKILVDLEDAINDELGILHSSLESLNPLRIGGVLEKAVNKISDQVGDYDEKLTSDLDNTVGNILGIL